VRTCIEYHFVCRVCVMTVKATTNKLISSNKHLTVCGAYYKIGFAFLNCINELFASLAVSVKQIGNSEELFLYTVVLTNILTSTYLHKENIIISSCWSE
jgi:hypothetical protein